MLAYDLNGYKDILGIWLSESESKHFWMSVFDEVKSRGVEDIFILSMDGVSLRRRFKKYLYRCTNTKMYSSFNT